MMGGSERKDVLIIQAPEICQLYAVPVSPSLVRLKIRQDFERNRHIQDLGVIDMLLHKNQQEYQETVNAWKQEVSSTFWETGRSNLTLSPTSCTGSKGGRIHHGHKIS